MECALNFYPAISSSQPKKSTRRRMRKRAQLKLSRRTFAKSRHWCRRDREEDFTTSAAKITTSRARFSRCCIDSILGQERGRASARSSASLATPARVLELLDATIARPA